MQNMMQANIQLYHKLDSFFQWSFNISILDCRRHSILTCYTPIHHQSSKVSLSPLPAFPESTSLSVLGSIWHSCPANYDQRAPMLSAQYHVLSIAKIIFTSHFNLFFSWQTLCMAPETGDKMLFSREMTWWHLRIK